MLELISAFLRDITVGIIIVINTLLGVFSATETAVVTQNEPEGVEVEEAAPVTSAPGTSGPQENIPSPPAKQAASIDPLPPPQPAVVYKTAEEVNALVRPALVNILCSTAASGPLNALSGSGVMVDSRGVILTNAHVGQYFLLRDYPQSSNVDCVIRSGEPASPKYRGVLLFLPPEWIEENAGKITQEAPTGTGEYDFAFILITEAVGPGVTLPPSYPALATSIEEPSTGDPTLLAAYPAGFLGGVTVAKSLFISSALSNIKGIFTFTGNSLNIDLIAVGGTVVSQSGSSGGAVARMTDGALVGLIVTATTAETTAERDLRAITLAHINRGLQNAGFGGIADLLSGNLSSKAERFKQETSPGLTASLVGALENQ